MKKGAEKKLIPILLDDDVLESHPGFEGCVMIHKAHVESDKHMKNASYAGCEAASSSASRTTPPKVFGKEARAPVEKWQENLQDGFLQCIPCGKVIDDYHLATEDHQNRLGFWEHRQQLQAGGYPAPALPYLAWVPSDPSDPKSERWEKCLLCRKWVQDTAHSGTREQALRGDSIPASNGHIHNLKAWGPGNQWYETNVVQMRLTYHPHASGTAPTVSTAECRIKGCFEC
jgi:hypothetical protein